MTDPESSAFRHRAVACGLTDRGMQREHNEDSFVVLDELNLFIVADGMGGHRAGDVASRLATESIADFFRATATEDVTWPFHFDANLSDEENRLLTGIRIANRQILDRSERSRECQGMGTTVVGCMYAPGKNKLFIAHVGDSRCYRIREGELTLLTRDHSLLNDYLLAMPELTEEQKSELPRNVITRALGMQRDVVVDLQADSPRPNDTYLLCSDGLNGMLRDDEIRDVLNGTRDLATVARQLVDRANENGGEDNVTVVLIRIDDLSTLSPTIVPAPVPGSGKSDTDPSPPVIPVGFVDEDTELGDRAPNTVPMTPEDIDERGPTPVPDTDPNPTPKA
jgi:PPM family protein phosphatase